MVSNYSVSYKQREIPQALTQEGIQQNLQKSSQAVKENLGSNSVVKTVSGSNEGDSKKEAIKLLPVIYLADTFIDKTIGGPESKSLLKKIANIGDRISNSFHLDKIFSEEKAGKLTEFIKNNRFTKYFTKAYKANAKSSLAKGQTLADNYVSKAVDMLSKLKSSAGDTVEYFDSAKGFFKPETLKHFGLSDGIAASKNTASKEMISDLAQGIDKILSGNVPESINASKLSTVNNKLKAATSNMGETLVGKGLAKGALKTKDLLTYGGGLLSLFFTASALANAIKATKEAPKGEKKSTFMHVLSEQYVGLLLFTPSINLLYKIGGNKYRGMTLEGRKALADLIAKTNADGAITKEGLKLARLQKNLLLKGVDKDKVAELAGKTLQEAKEAAKSLKGQGAKLKFWEKPLKALGKVLSTGLDDIKKSKFIKLPVLGKVKLPTLKGFASGFGRFLIIMMVIQPIIQKPVTKLCHKIFGEPKTYLNKMKQKENSSASPNAQPSSSNATTNLVDRWSQQLSAENQPQESPVPAQNITSEENPQPLTPPLVVNINNPVEQQTASEEIPALNLFKKKSDYNGYIPSIDVEVDKKQAKAVEKQVDQIIKDTEKFMKNARKNL